MGYDNDISSLYPTGMTTSINNYKWIHVPAMWIYETYEHAGKKWHRIGSVENDIVDELENRGYTNTDGFHIPDELYTLLVLKYG